MLSSFHPVHALLTMMAAGSIADLSFLLPHWPSLSSTLLSIASDNKSATTY